MPDCSQLGHSCSSGYCVYPLLVLALATIRPITHRFKMVMEKKIILVLNFLWGHFFLFCKKKKKKKTMSRHACTTHPYPPKGTHTHIPLLYLLLLFISENNSQWIIKSWTVCSWKNLLRYFPLSTWRKKKNGLSGSLWSMFVNTICRRLPWKAEEKTKSIHFPPPNMSLLISLT